MGGSLGEAFVTPISANKLLWLAKAYAQRLTINEAASEQGVPWFRKLPVLGWLFKTRNITNENRELLIFITPKILKVS